MQQKRIVTGYVKCSVDTVSNFDSEQLFLKFQTCRGLVN